MPIGPVIDCDVHHEIAEDADLIPYLSEGWREFVFGPGDGRHLPVLPPYGNYVNPHGFHRREARLDDGRPEGSSYEKMREQLLDPYEVAHAVLTYNRVGFGGFRNPYYATEVARACNDFTIEHWLSRDERLKGSVLVTSQMPDDAAAEIRRLADTPQMVQVVIYTNALGPAFGHPIHEPIHRAAAETGLPLAVHSLGDGSGSAVTSSLASSHGPDFYIEYHAGGMQGMLTHLMSFIFHGVFDRYTDLRLVLTEGGTAWLPSALRRLDEDYRALRQEVPWCKRHPSEYVHDQVRLTTQPLDIESPSDPLLAPMQAYGLEDVLMYSSDYPHWDADAIEQVARRMPNDWTDKVLRENAAELYGLTIPVAV